MHLEQLRLANFRNYESAHFSFAPRANCLLGPNGVGKTNALDAIHYLGLTKSALNAIDADNLRHGASQFWIKGIFSMRQSTDEVVCAYGAGVRKSMCVNSKELPRMAAHVGHYPLVLVAPADSELIGGGSRLRRRFFDGLICQADRQYLDHLAIYTHQLRQRDSLLRQTAAAQPDLDLLDAYDQKMAAAGMQIREMRIAFARRFVSPFMSRYRFLVGSKREEAHVGYIYNEAEEDIYKQLKAALPRDIALGRTTVGPHRDNFTFSLNGYPLKSTGSQGQQKSFVLSLKIAAFQMIEEAKGFKPLLLLDDIFDKLDEERTDKLLELMAGEAFGQYFITDAAPGRSRSLLASKGIEAEFLPIEPPSS